MELNWRETYERAYERFGGQTPGAQLEAELIERFEQSPTALVAAVDKLAERYAAGRIHSPWPLLLRELEQAPARDVVASDGPERTTQVRLAERWIRNAGLYEPDERALDDALFGEHGRLKAWADDAELRAQMAALWRHEQPRGLRADAEQLERAERWKAANHATMRVSDPPASADMDTRTARNPRLAGESLDSAPWSPSARVAEQLEPLLERDDIGELVDADADIDWAAA